MTNLLKSFKPYLYILFGNSVGTLFQFILLPVLTRLYSEEDFAIYAVIMSWSIIAYLFSTFRYDTPILQAENKQEVTSLNTFCVVASCFVTFVSMALLYFKIISIESTHITLMFAILISCTFAGYSLVEVVCKNLIYAENYKQVGIIRSVATMLTASLQIAISFIYISGEALIIARVIALVLVLILSCIFLTHLGRISSFINFSLTENFVTYKKYIKFPKIDLPSGILNYISSNLPYLFVPFYYGLVPEMGFYALVSRVFQGPVNLLRNSIKNVFHKEATIRYKNGVFPSQYLCKTLLIIIAICFPFTFIIIIWGEHLFSLFFSETWRAAGQMATYAALFFITLLLRSPVQCALQIIQCQAVNLKLEVIDIIIKISFTFIVLQQAWSVLDWIYGFFIIATITNILNIMYSIYLIKNCKPKDYLCQP
jgi:O-antigen/teichoic acid export membrane protein